MHKHILPPEALQNMLQQTAVPRNVLTQGDDIEYGYGLLHPSKLLQQLENNRL